MYDLTAEICLFFPIKEADFILLSSSCVIYKEKKEVSLPLKTSNSFQEIPLFIFQISFKINIGGN